VVRNKRYVSLNDCEVNVMRMRQDNSRLQWMSKERAECCYLYRVNMCI